VGAWSIRPLHYQTNVTVLSSPIYPIIEKRKAQVSNPWSTELQVLLSEHFHKDDTVITKYEMGMMQK
jgi:hypothetical protein